MVTKVQKWGNSPDLVTFDADRMLAEERLVGRVVIREPLRITA